jgi:hypothetical protein
MDLKEIGWSSVDLTQLADYEFQWLAVIETTMQLLLYYYYYYYYYYITVYVYSLNLQT